MADYPIDFQLVADPVTFQRAANALVTVYDINDANNTTPLALKDLNGLPMANPMKSTAEAITPPFISPVPDIKLVGGGYTIPVSSVLGLRNAAATAATAAQKSAVDASTATADRITAATVDSNGRLKLTKGNGQVADAGAVIGPRGDKGDTGAPGAAGISNIALDDDGTPYFIAGSNAVQILADTDGAPYYV